ncbi:MAG: ABC transporter ATP-binding protein [Acidimicrobiales bacterium]
MSVAIELESLTKFYGPHRGVEDLDLEVATGQVFGFLGPNGAGKSTTMRVLMDFHRASSGRARVLGLDSRADSLAVKRDTGYLSGDVALYERLSAIDHLEWLASLRGGVAKSQIELLSERLGLDLSRRIGDLSKGNRQKVGLVQAFMHEPAVLILDEPTSGLDPIVQHTFQEMVREVAAEGRTVFLSSHILDEVDRACDRVAIIRDGRMVAVESIASLRRRSLREVRVTFDHDVAAAEFASLPGVHSVTKSEKSLLIRTAGELDPIIKQAARHRVTDLVSERADLESIFLALYGFEDGEDTDSLDPTSGLS